MTISVSNSEDRVSIILAERFDFSSVEQFRKAYESLADLTKKTVAIDFRNTQYIDSSALGMLINAKSFFNSREVKPVIINANDKIKKIFSISRFDVKFEIQ